MRLPHRDIRLLLVEPGVSWNRKDMAKAYKALADRIGAPQAVLVDGAVELREGAEVLQKYRKDVMILGDFKHFAANVLKKIVSSSESFCQIHVTDGEHAISYPAGRIESFDAAQSPAQSPLHESGCNADVGGDGVVATDSSAFQSAS